MIVYLSQLEYTHFTDIRKMRSKHILKAAARSKKLDSVHEMRKMDLERKLDIVKLKELMMSKDVDDRTFGLFVRNCREQRGYSVRGFASKLGCSAAYLSDVEKGHRNASKKYLDKIFEMLVLPEEDRQTFDDLAAATRGFQYDDINPYLGQTPKARMAIRAAMEMNASDEYWQAFIDGLKVQA